MAMVEKESQLVTVADGMTMLGGMMPKVGTMMSIGMMRTTQAITAEMETMRKRNNGLILKRTVKVKHFSSTTVPSTVQKPQ